MSKVENLNKTLLEFCDDLEVVIPKFKKFIDNVRDKVKEKMTTKYYLEYYFRHCLPFAEEISKCDSENLGEMSIIHGVKFSDVNQEEMTVSSRQALWKYLHTFYLLVQGYSHLDKILEKYQDLENIQKIKDNLENHSEILKNIMNSSTKFAEEILKNTTENTSGNAKEFAENIMKNVDEKKFEEQFLNSGIGNLAKEISSEIDPKELENLKNPQDLFSALLGGGGDAGGLTNIIQKVGDKLQDKMAKGQIDQDALMKEASSMMGMLGPAMQGMGGAGGMEGMGDLMSMFGGMGGGGKKKKSKRRNHKT